MVKKRSWRLPNLKLCACCLLAFCRDIDFFVLGTSNKNINKYFSIPVIGKGIAQMKVTSRSWRGTINSYGVAVIELSEESKRFRPKRLESTYIRSQF